MPTTLRLLSTYNGNPPNTIITVENDIAAQLLQGGVGATLTLAGGVYRDPPAAQPQRYLVAAEVDREGGVSFLGPDGLPVKIKPHVANDSVVESLGVSSVYQSRAMYDQLLVHGAVQQQSNSSFGYHDLLRNNSIIDALHGKPNFNTMNIGGPLAPIPGATTAPYWTDPGPVTLSTGANTFTAEAVAGQLDFVKDGYFDCAQFTSKAGYGNAAGGNRRVQLNSYEITSRVRVAWDLSFKITEADDLPYHAETGYKYPMLLWQTKGGSFPTWALNVESDPDGIHYWLYMTFRWYGTPSATETFRRHVSNASGSFSGNFNASSNTTKYVNVKCKKGEWTDVVIEMYLDERDIFPTDTPATSSGSYGGRGFCNVWVNGKQELAYAGPTLQYKNADGSPSIAHHWGIGIYRHESGVPAELKELDLNRQVNPAPFQRQVRFRRARLMRLMDK